MLHQRAAREKRKDPGESLSDKALAWIQQPETVAQKSGEQGGSTAFTGRVPTFTRTQNHIVASYNSFEWGIYFECVAVYRCYALSFLKAEAHLNNNNKKPVWLLSISSIC